MRDIYASNPADDMISRFQRDQNQREIAKLTSSAAREFVGVSAASAGAWILGFRAALSPSVLTDDLANAT